MEKSEIVKHFQKEGNPRKTNYDTINRMQLGRTINDKKNTDRPTSWTPARKNQLKRLANNHKGVSQRRFGISRITLCRQLLQMNISCYKREKTPKYSEKQAEKAKNFCKKLANLLQETSCCLILDDEKYFTYDGSNMQGNDKYYTNDKSKCPVSVCLAVSHIQSWYTQAIISSVEVRCSQLGHLYKRMLRETLVSFHP